MKKYSIFSLLLSLFALNGANAGTCAMTAENCYQTAVRYPATETVACYDAVDYNAAPCVFDTCDNSGMYVGLIGGANWLHNKHFKHNDIKLNVGYLAGGSIGYQFNNGLRLEGEISYRHNKARNLHFTKHTSLNSWSYMVNAFYDFDLDSEFTPYVGVGVGYTDQFISISKLKVEDSPRTDVKLHAEDGLAWQAIAGVNYKIDAKTSVGVEYRYFAGRSHMHNHGANVAVRRMF